MRKRKTVYCELDFLRKFLNNRPTILEPNDESIHQMECWVALYKFICKSDLVINVSEEEYNKLQSENPWMAMLWKKSTQGECGLDFEKDHFVSIDELKSSNPTESALNAVFLTTSEDDACINIAKEFGVVAINTNNMMDCLHLYRDNGTAFPSEKAKKWDFMAPLNYCYPQLLINNSLLIVDNYLFKSNTNKYGEVLWTWEDKLEYNLKPILDCILPEDLSNSMVYEITIISGEKGEDYESQYNYVKSIVKKLRPKLNFKVAFYVDSFNDKSIFHDRCIVSNNVWISCGHGFDVFKQNTKQPTKSTTVNISFPFFQSYIQWVDNSFLNLMEDANKVVYKEKANEERCWKDSNITNRMIRHYIPQEEKKSLNDSITYNEQAVTIGKAKILGKIDLSALNRYNRR